MNNEELQSRISARSYAIWEREGCQDGHSEEYWDRARREIEAEMLDEAIEGNSPEIAMPQLRISQRPVRHDGWRIKAA